jgi:hypothetical protein
MTEQRLPDRSATQTRLVIGLLLVPLLALSLIFGTVQVGLLTLLLGLYALALTGLRRTRSGMQTLGATVPGLLGMILLVPVLALAGLFGNAVLMMLALLLAGVALTLAALAPR